MKTLWKFLYNTGIIVGTVVISFTGNLLVLALFVIIYCGLALLIRWLIDPAP
jgi:hypothetical protein